MQATIQKQSRLEGVTKITLTLSDGSQYEITEGRAGLVVKPGVVCEARRYDGLAWEIGPDVKTQEL